MNHGQRKRQFNVNIFSNVNNRKFPKLIEESIHVQETFTIPNNMQNKETLLKVQWRKYKSDIKDNSKFLNRFLKPCKITNTNLMCSQGLTQRGARFPVGRTSVCLDTNTLHLLHRNLFKGIFNAHNGRGNNKPYLNSTKQTRNRKNTKP